MNGITLNKHEVEALRRVIDYAYDDELKDWLAAGKPGN